MKKRLRFAAALVIAIALNSLVAAAATAGTVRGQLLRVAPNGYRYPAPGLAVTVFRQDMGRSGAAYTGYDGMYYLNNIPPGYYVLEIWNGGRVIAWYTIVVYNQPLTDIAPIVVP